MCWIQKSLGGSKIIQTSSVTVGRMVLVDLCLDIHIPLGSKSSMFFLSVTFLNGMVEFAGAASPLSSLSSEMVLMSLDRVGFVVMHPHLTLSLHCPITECCICNYNHIQYFSPLRADMMNRSREICRGRMYHGSTLTCHTWPCSVKGWIQQPPSFQI